MIHATFFGSLLSLPDLKYKYIYISLDHGLKSGNATIQDLDDGGHCI